MTSQFILWKGRKKSSIPFRIRKGVSAGVPEKITSELPRSSADGIFVTRLRRKRFFDSRRKTTTSNNSDRMLSVTTAGSKEGSRKIKLKLNK